MFKSLWLWWKQRSFHKLRHARVEDVFTDVYTRNTWGGTPGSFYSGDGTHHPDTQRYIDKVRTFIIDQKITSILEIGCGDFHVAGQILKDLDVKYLGGDVVESLIHHHQKTLQTNRVQFKTINAIDDVLPAADLIIIRQVLQHLSNEHILKILKKLPAFKYALITEHLPASAHPDVNLDKITGPHIRMKFNSGVFITEPPFNIANATLFLEYPHDDFIKGKRVPATLRTYLVTQPA